MDDLLTIQQIQIETLQKRVRQLTDALVPPDFVVPIEWRLTRNQARVFAHLATRDEASKQSIMLAVYSDRVDIEPEIKIIDVFVCKMRAKLKPYGVEIVTLWGRGYALKDRSQFSRKVAA